MRYVVSRGVDKTSKEYYYCHKDGFPYIPVFGSIGSKTHANKICREMNRSVGK